MKRINLYIPEETDILVDNLSEMIQVNRSEIIRKAIELYAEKYTTELNEFTQGLTGLEEPKTENVFLKTCFDNVEYFIENAVSINTFDGVHPFKLYDFQKQLLFKLDNYNQLIITHARQLGITTTTLAYALHYALTKPNQVIGLVSTKMILSQEMLTRLKDMYSSLPEIIKTKVTLETSNKTGMVLSNGTRIMCTTADCCSIRGLSINMLIIDNASYITDVKFKDFLDIVLPTQPTKVIISSSPNGYNYYYKLWVDAITNCNPLHAIMIKWDVLSQHRDQEWKNRLIKEIGSVQFSEEFECEFINKTNKGNLYS